VCVLMNHVRPPVVTVSKDNLLFFPADMSCLAVISSDTVILASLGR